MAVSVINKDFAQIRYSNDDLIHCSLMVADKLLHFTNQTLEKYP